MAERFEDDSDVVVRGSVISRVIISGHESLERRLYVYFRSDEGEEFLRRNFTEAVNTLNELVGAGNQFQPWGVRVLRGSVFVEFVTIGFVGTILYPQVRRGLLEMTSDLAVICGQLSHRFGGAADSKIETETLIDVELLDEQDEPTSIWTLDEVLDVLERNTQRATYGAVAGVVGGIARGLMQGRPKTPRNSWVVAKGNGRPTGYSPDEMHPQLFSKSHVIADGDELLAWLGEHY